MKFSAGIISFVSMISAASAINYNIDCGPYGSGAISVSPGNVMNFDMNLENLIPSVAPAGVPLSYHLHTIWTGIDGDFSLDTCGVPYTALHYDPVPACGPASEAVNTPACPPAFVAEYSNRCSPDTPAGCEVGDLSGKYGNMIVNADGTSTESVQNDVYGADNAHFVADNADVDPDLWSSIVFHDTTRGGARVLCCAINLAPSASSDGDPHFKTWSGKWYDFMGACDLHLLKAPVMDLVIDIRTKIRYSYSYIETAVVKIGQETLEVSSFGEYALNGVASANLPGKLSGYPVVHSRPSDKQHRFEIQIDGDEKIVLTTFKDMVTVKMENAEVSKFRNSLGMMGAFDKDGLMLARDGQTVIEDPNAFAAEWQVRDDEPMLFSTVNGPQYPQKCEMPSESMLAEKSRRLGESLAREAAEKACAHWPEDTRDACIYDCLATGDLDLASAGAY